MQPQVEQLLVGGGKGAACSGADNTLTRCCLFHAKRTHANTAGDGDREPARIRLYTVIDAHSSFAQQSALGLSKSTLGLLRVRSDDGEQRGGRRADARAAPCHDQQSGPVRLALRCTSGTVRASRACQHAPRSWPMDWHVVIRTQLLAPSKAFSGVCDVASHSLSLITSDDHLHKEHGSWCFHLRGRRSSGTLLC